MQDLSASAADSMWVTSQGGGNVSTVRPGAMSAPGSMPVNPRLGEDENPPQVSFTGPVIEPGHTGKPAPGTSPPAGGHAWARTATAGPGPAPHDQ